MFGFLGKHGAIDKLGSFSFASFFVVGCRWFVGVDRCVCVCVCVCVWSVYV